jgi:hypothetical protein
MQKPQQSLSSNHLPSFLMNRTKSGLYISLTKNPGGNGYGRVYGRVIKIKILFEEYGKN